MNKSGGLECVAWTWGIAALAAIFTASALWVLGGWTFMQGAFMGVLALLILGALLTIMTCRDLKPAGTVARDSAAAARPARAAAEPAAAPAARAAAPETAPAPVAPEAPEAPAAAAVETETAAADEGTRPVALDGPRGGTADDLKRIKGIGPKLEILCNELGFYHFDQIAAWTADEVAWVDENLQGFKGRVTRDAWVDQARRLAAGGETEFSKKVDDGDVY